MEKFIVRQQVPHWVTCVQVVEADTPEEAMKSFNPNSHETSKIVGSPVTDMTPGPLCAFDAEDRWSETYPIEDWIGEVSNGDTKLGYREWLAIRSEVVDED